jgi:hypothetical protein
MIHSLRNFDPIVAAGILARAALSVADSRNPAAAIVLPNEQTVREKLLQEARQIYGIANDESPESQVRLCDALDAESDALLEPVNDMRALERLALRGDLPSDLYEINVVKNIQDCYGEKYSEERHYIETTVRTPDAEQHYNSRIDSDELRLISLFAKTFHDKFPVRSFVMLVAGERHGLTLTVIQAWRAYPEDVNLVGAHSPFEMLERFASAFGSKVTFGDQTGQFMLVNGIREGTRIPVHAEITPMPGKSRRQINVTHIAFKSNEATQDILTIGIDLDRYRDALRRRGW